MKRINVALLCLFLSHPSYSFQSTQAIDNLIQHYQADMIIGMEVFDPVQGKVIYQHHPHSTFHPGSTTKLFTSFAALKVLGPDYQFKSHIAYNKPKQNKVDMVAIRFEGDPTLKHEDYISMIQSLTDSGIKTIEGDFILDDTAFSGPPYPPGWTWDDFNWGYAPPITAYSLNRNRIDFEFTSSKSIGDKMNARLKSNLPDIEIDSKVMTVTDSEAQDCAFDVIQQANHFSFRGCFAIHKDRKTFKLANRDIKTYMPIYIKQLLEDANIQLQGMVKYSEQKLPIQKTFVSVPLSEILKEILQDSENVYSENLLRVLGYHENGIGSSHEGIKVVKRVLKDHVGIDVNQLNLSDGSGISQYNLFSASQLNRLLYAAYHDESYPIFKEALSLSGVNGTLKRRLTSFDMKEKISAKTGSLTGRSSLSGFLKDKEGKVLIMSMMVNNSIHSRQKLKDFEDQMMMTLYSTALLN